MTEVFTPKDCGLTDIVREIVLMVWSADSLS